MKTVWLCAAGVVILVGAGCEKKDQDAAMAQGLVVVNKAQEFAGNAWKSACDTANRLTADSGRPALEAAKRQLEAARAKISTIKAPSSMDDLKLDSVKEQIARMEAALSIQNLKAEMDEKVKQATEAKDNAAQKIDDVRKKLDETNAEYRDLKDKLSQAQQIYDTASDRVKETAKKVEDAANSIHV